MDTSQHRTSIRHRIIRSAWTAVASGGLIGGSLMVAASPASATATNQYSLYQCANGGKGTLASCSGAQYQHGDLNASNSHWAEGDFVSFQLVLTNITKGQHHVILQYETVNSGKHAYDYLGSYDATETTSSKASPAHANDNNACTGVVADCVPATPLPITTPDLSGVNTTCGSGIKTPTPPSVPGYFNLWGPAGSALDSMAYETPIDQTVQQGKTVSDCHTLVDVYFTSPVDGSDMVLAWGAHVASEADWGPNTGAGSISGAPYHMWVEGIDTVQGGGDQERSMQVSTAQPTISTVIENAAGAPVTQVTAGTTVHDTATLAGATSNAGGTVTYELFANGNCTGQPLETYPAETVTDGGVPNSPDFTPQGAGTYSYEAIYSGDYAKGGSNLPATGACEGPLAVTGDNAPVVTVVKSETTPGDGQTVTAGQSAVITYKLAVYNWGSADAYDETITDVIPTGTTYVDNSAKPSTATPSYDSSTKTVSWTVSDIPPAVNGVPSEVDLTFQVTVDASDANGSSIVNQASFGNNDTPGCSGDTCLTNQVTNPVIVPQSGGGGQQEGTTTTTSTPAAKVAAAASQNKQALAFTGAHSGLLGLLGAGLIGSGGVIVMLSRRRRNS